jgi:hypothetical protein
MKTEFTPKEILQLKDRLRETLGLPEANFSLFLPKAVLNSIFREVWSDVFSPCYNYDHVLAGKVGLLWNDTPIYTDAYSAPWEQYRYAQLFGMQEKAVPYIVAAVDKTTGKPKEYTSAESFLCDVRLYSVEEVSLTVEVTKEYVQQASMKQAASLNETGSKPQ